MDEYQKMVSHFSCDNSDIGKTLKAKESHDRLALFSFFGYDYHNIILFDLQALQALDDEDEKIRKVDPFYFLKVPHNEIYVMDDRGEPKPLDLFGCTYLEKSIVLGFAQLRRPLNRYQHLGAYEIFRIVAKKGIGPLLFELVFAFAAKKKRPVIIDRGEVSSDARKVWEKFDFRREIIAYPAALRKYPELVGFSKDEVEELFGPGIYHSSTFDRFGFPDSISLDRKNQLFSKINPHVREEYYGRFASRSYIEDEGTHETNLAVGGLASLDKAFYFDGRVGLFDTLIEKAKALRDYQSRKYALWEVGFAFFNSFAPKKPDSKKQAA